VSPKKRLTRAERDTLDTAWHEAGHVIGAWAGGLRVSSVWCTGERAAMGRTVGNTQLNAMDTMFGHRPPDEVLHVQALAGDAVGFENLRGDGPDEGHLSQWRPTDREHINDVAAKVGHPAFDQLWAEAKALVWERRADIETVARAILASPDLALHPGRDAIIDEGNEAAAPGRKEADRQLRATQMSMYQKNDSG
jgi:hypothetical protein